VPFLMLWLIFLDLGLFEIVCALGGVIFAVFDVWNLWFGVGVGGGGACPL
jgi:hypothetical protein